jgi:hypothetical protein
VQTSRGYVRLPTDEEGEALVEEPAKDIDVVNYSTIQLLKIRKCRNGVFSYASLALTEISYVSVLSVWMFTPIQVGCIYPRFAF